MRYHLVLAVLLGIGIGGIVYDNYLEKKEIEKARIRVEQTEQRTEQRISSLEKEILKLKKTITNNQKNNQKFFWDMEKKYKRNKKDIEGIKDYFVKDGIYDFDSKLSKNLFSQLEEAKKSVVEILGENIYENIYEKEVVPSEPFFWLPGFEDEREGEERNQKKKEVMLPSFQIPGLKEEKREEQNEERNQKKEVVPSEPSLPLPGLNEDEKNSIMSKISIPVTFTGFVYKKEKDALYIITTEHPISMSRFYTFFDMKKIGQNFYLLYGEEKIPLEVLMSNEEIDFCMMKTKYKKDIKKIREIPFPLGNSNKLRAGSLIFAISIAAESKIISKGYVRGENEIKGYLYEDPKNAFIANIEANPGDSGAPVIGLMDGKPEVVGLISATRTRIKGGDSCIKINAIKKAIKDSKIKDN